MTENELTEPQSGAEIKSTLKLMNIDVVVRQPDGTIRERRTQVQKEI